MKQHLLMLVFLTQVAGAAGQNDGREATSLLGKPLMRPELAAETRTRLEKDLSDARAAYERSPDQADAIIWLGRRLAYLGRYREAIDAFSEGARKHPNDARMYRHRGHRYITVRELDNAIRDLERAAALERGQADEIEPDGAPNRFNIPTSTLQSNIWYHLALAHYLKHDFEKALSAWREAMVVSTNDDMRVATSDWLYMTYRRLGRTAEAAKVLEPIHKDMRILENDAYHKRLLMYKGELTPESLLAFDNPDPVQVATFGYGVANWYLYNGQRERAVTLFQRILEARNWAPFGFIAAEAELAGRVTR
ncbi:MAG: tetratricopeptide repeat protein [Longimicrobiales bacterium]